MKKIICLLSICTSFNAFAQLTYIPDDAFEAYLENNFPLLNNGTANDNYILSSGISSVISIGISGGTYDVQDFTGIEAFTSMWNFSVQSLTATTIDLSSLNFTMTSPFNYLKVFVQFCNNLINLKLSHNNICVNIKNNPLLQNIEFQNTNVFYSLNPIQDNNSITCIDISNTAGVNPGAQLWVSGNTSLSGLKLDNGQCSNWQGVHVSSNGTVSTITPSGTLYCVQVDNPAYSETASLWFFANDVDPSTYYYSTNCNSCTSELKEKTTDITSIYPNPSNGQFTLVLENLPQANVYSIYDQQGREVKSGKVNGKKTTINLELNTGMYYLKVDNKVVKVQVVKE